MADDPDADRRRAVEQGLRDMPADERARLDFELLLRAARARALAAASALGAVYKAGVDRAQRPLVALVARRVPLDASDGLVDEARAALSLSGLLSLSVSLALVVCSLPESLSVLSFCSL